MIITQKKPKEELLAMLEGVTKVALVGCGQCASACQTGGEKELGEMKAFLEENDMGWTNERTEPEGEWEIERHETEDGEEITLRPKGEQ